MRLRARRFSIFMVACSLAGFSAPAQIDPDRRQLLQFAYDGSFEGRAPIAAYAFYYLNRPEFYREDLTLRLAIAPTYFNTELGIAHALGPNTAIGIGAAGGGFANRYDEVRDGNYIQRESFDGHGAGATLSIYHRFNPNQRIPLNGLLRGGGQFTIYSQTDDTSGQFELPNDRAAANFRVGLRYGGKEPVLFPNVAMELSVWAESLNRTANGSYGFDNDRDVHGSVQLFYAHAYLAYTFDRGDNLSVSMTAGDSAKADRFSAYRIGGFLPLVAEYPLVLPGYFYQEISAESFALFNGRYALALDHKKRWQLTAMAATAVVNYLDGLELPDKWQSGVGGGITYKSSSEVWKFGLNYGYGIDAIRESGHGAHVFGVVLQIDLEKWLNDRGSKPFPWNVH